MIVTGEEVVEWVCAGTGGGSYRHAIGLGEQRDGQPVAGVVVESWNGSNAMLHIRIVKAPGRRFWDSLFDHLFDTMQCNRVTAVIDASNVLCIDLVERLQFVKEAVLAKAGRANSDAIVYVLWSWNRRFFLKRNTI